jgi:hypothetical protein
MLVPAGVLLVLELVLVLVLVVKLLLVLMGLGLGAAVKRASLTRLLLPCTSTTNGCVG